MLAEQVKAGKLPPVDQRLPADPLVVPVVERTGQYGGVWRRAFLGPADFNNYVRVVYDALARFSPDGAKIEPKIAAGLAVVDGLQDLDDPAPQGRAMVGRRALHRRRHRVLVQGRPPEQGPDAGHPGLDAERRRHGRRGREGRRPDGPLHLQAAGDALPDRARQPGRRRPDLRGLPARPLPEEVPPRATRRRKTSTSSSRRRASRPGPSCSPPGTRPSRTPSGRPWRAWVPVDAGRATRSSRCGAIRTSSASIPTATSCPTSTRSASPSSPTSRRSTWPPSPARSTCRSATSR